MVAGGIYTYWLLAVRDTGPIPRTYTRGLDITLYYPDRLPQGYTVDNSSFQRQDNVLIFSIKAPKGRNIAVSQQAAPADAPSVEKTGNTPFTMPGERSFTTGIGHVNISLWGNKYVSDISTTEGTWIILNTTGFTADEAAAVAKSFVKLQ